MIAPELEREEINQISPLKVERYLERKGWRRIKLIADLDWGSVNPEKVGFAEVSYSNILKALEIISKKEVENPIRVSVIGKLMLAGVGNDKKTRKFIFEEQETHKDYKGTISKELLKTLNNDLNVGKKRYKATLEEITSVDATGEEETTYILVGLEDMSR